MLRLIGTLVLVTVIAGGVSAGVLMFFPTAAPLAATLGAASDIPSQINHQGVVSVSGARFTGTAQFCFAIVDPDTGNNVWTNDGSNVGSGNRPNSAASLVVTDGIYDVRLGDTTLTNMTAIPSSIFNNGNLRLRIWFNDGTHGIGQLSPDHVLAGAPYAHRAATGFGFTPVGGIAAWHKSFAHTPPLPDGWVECNGQVLNDPASPYHGQTMPDLNGQARFLRGGAISGTLQADQFQSHQHEAGSLDTGSTTHTHHWAEYYASGEPFAGGDNYWGGRQNGNFSADHNLGGGSHNHPVTGSVGNPSSGNYGSETRRIHMCVVWIMRVK